MTSHLQEFKAVRARPDGRHRSITSNSQYFLKKNGMSEIIPYSSRDIPFTPPATPNGSFQARDPFSTGSSFIWGKEESQPCFKRMKKDYKMVQARKNLQKLRKEYGNLPETFQRQKKQLVTLNAMRIDKLTNLLRDELELEKE